MASVTRYVPRDYRRVCDTCGVLRNISQMWRKANGLFACTYDEGERDALTLSKGNARQRPFRVRPVPYPKPLDPNYPNTFEADEGALLNFVDTMISARAQYAQVTSGMVTPLNSSAATANALPALSWSCRYLYDLIQDGTRPTWWISRAKNLLQSAADYLLTRQAGSAAGFASSYTQANNAFYGGFLASGSLGVGSNVWLSEDAATCGLALLDAYRVLGGQAYLIGARAAASFLRNVQAIGSAGTNYTSSDSAGSARLYTGAVTSYVANLAGFYSDHCFYPAGLLALEFWNELRTTDGDQTIGATATVTGFSTTPGQLLSQSISDMRAFWLSGVADATGTVSTGLSATTPAEFFNAYPATKPNTSPTATGTGRWEYQDGGVSTGTLVTATNFAKALEALFAYEGQTDQVGSVSDWLRSFSANPAYAFPSSYSDRDLSRNTYGAFSATTAPATLLLVRDSANSYAATAKNGSSLYDWGAFGLLSRLWAARNGGSWRDARILPLNTVRRLDDGTPNDERYDRIALRGRSGLDFQTYFTETIQGASRMVNDVVAAAQFGRNYREARS